MLTNKQQIIKNRRDVVGEAYKGLADKKQAVSPLVEYLAKRFKVSQVTIYGDLKYLGLTNKPKTNSHTATSNF